MRLSDLLNNTAAGIGNIVNDYRRNTASQKEPPLPQGSPNIFQALGVLLKDKQRQKEIEDYGGYTLDNPIELMYGTAKRSNDFDRIGEFRDKMNYHGGFANPENRQLPDLEKEYGREFAPEVLGAQALSQQYEQPIAGEVQDPYAKYVALPQVQGRQRVEDIVPDEGTIQKYVKNAKKWAGTVSADPRLTFRQKETVKENAEYVGQYVEAVMRLAPYFDLPPKTVASMAMQESGWGGQRFDGNLSGYGFLESGEDMGFRFDAPTVEEQAAKFLEQLSKYRYAGSRTPEDFASRGYNPHKEYPGKVRSIMGMLEAN
jgi:hypothetical protein